MIALASMLRNDLVDPDTLLDSAYTLEDELQSHVTHEFLYLIGQQRADVLGPFGYVWLDQGGIKPSGDVYRIEGWALDRSKVEDIVLLADHVVTGLVPIRGIRRPDIEKLFPSFGSAKDRLASGFAFEIPVRVAAGKRVLVTIRLSNDAYRFRDILSRELYFEPPH